jgi:hypothetical protein
MLITLDSPGQLGNRLQLCAHIMSHALENNHSVMIFCLDEYADLFQGCARKIHHHLGKTLIILPKLEQNSLLSRLLNRIVIRGIYRISWLAKLLKISEIQAYSNGVILSNPSYRNITHRSNIVLLRGYFYYDPQALTKHGDQVRHFFQPLDRHQNNIDTTITKARKIADILVGVHIRHGDYANYQNGKHFFSFAEYENVMGQMQSLFLDRSVHFLVCSDDTLSPETFSSGISWQPGPGNIIEDMYSLAECDYIIGPKSTFNSWSAFYGKVPRYEIQDALAQFTLDNFNFVECLGKPPLNSLQI